MNKLIITNNKLKAKVNKIEFDVMDIIYTNLYYHTGVKLNNDVIDIILPSGVNSNIPINFRERLTNILGNSEIRNGGDNITKMDCTHFSHLVCGINFSLNTRFDIKKFDIIEFNNPLVGDIVILSNDNPAPDSIKHFIIYLGEDLYISKLGTTGPIVISDIHEICKGYECNIKKILRLK